MADHHGAVEDDGMSPRNTTAAESAADHRFLEIVGGAATAYPAESELVRADLPDLSAVITENVAARRTTVVVHDDGSEVIVDPPEFGKIAAFILLVALAALGARRAQLEAAGNVVELPVGARVRLRPPSGVLAA
jgi:hypothetical protein